jgi:hypothetical protein
MNEREPWNGSPWQAIGTAVALALVLIALLVGIVTGIVVWVRWLV